MSEPPQQNLRSQPRVIRYLGIGFFLLSFVVPQRWAGGADFHLFGGCGAFVETPGLALDMITAHGYEARTIFSGLVAIAAWLGNFSIFFRLPLLPALAVIAIPWAAYAVFFTVLAGFIPFYFWALGIGLIHGTRLLEPAPAELTRTAWNGF